jgi:hypothetical protein
MKASQVQRVLVVAIARRRRRGCSNEVSRRAKEQPTQFTLLIPDVPERKTPDWTLEVAIPLLRGAAARDVEYLVGGPDPFVAVQAAVRDHDFDEPAL